jgi:hypothetical protein
VASQSAPLHLLTWIISYNCSLPKFFDSPPSLPVHPCSESLTKKPIAHLLALPHAPHHVLASTVCLKAESHIACRAHAVPMPCCAAKGLECVFPIWFTQCSRVWLTLAMPHPCHALTMPFFSRPQHSSPRSASSGYHVEFHEDCYQKHTNPPHNDPYLRL